MQNAIHSSENIKAEKNQNFNTVAKNLPYLLDKAPRRSLNSKCFRCGAYSGAALFKKS